MNTRTRGSNCPCRTTTNNRVETGSISHTVEPACKVHGCKAISYARSIFSWSQSESAILSYNLDERSARLQGQLSSDKTLTSQVDSSVLVINGVEVPRSLKEGYVILLQGGVVVRNMGWVDIDLDVPP